MRLVQVDQLEAGAVLGRDVQGASQSGPPLLRRGVALSDRFLRGLHDAGVRSVWIDDPDTLGIEPVELLTPETQARTAAAVETAITEVRAAFAEGGRLSSKLIDEMADVAQMIAFEIQNNPDVAMHLADMAGSDQYLLQHAVDVTALGTLLAKQYYRDQGWTDFTGRKRWDQIDPRLSKIALALLLHDIGKLAIPEEILTKPGPLTEAEWEIMRSHPEKGIAILGEHTSFLIRAVVRNHHEKFDGTGYPDARDGEGIHEFARIATVADVYDAVTSERPYKTAAPPHVGVAIIERGAGTEFDPDVVAAFSKVVFPFPPGYEVELADGRKGVVVDVEPDHPHQPRVRAFNANGTYSEVERARLRDTFAPESLAA